MRTVRWTENGRAVGGVLAGVVLLAAAVSLLGATVYYENAGGCPAPVLTGLPTDEALCAPLRSARIDLIRNLALAGGVVVLVSAATAGRAWAPTVERGVSWRAPLGGLAAAVVVAFLWTVTFPAGQYEDGLTSGLGQVFVATGVLAAWAGTSALRDVTTRAHLLAAAAVAVPAICAGVGAVEVIRRRSPSRPWRVQDADFPYPGVGSVALVSLGVTAALFAVAVALVRLGRRAPNLWVSAVLFTLGTAATVPVFVADLVPAWRGYDDRPGPLVWLPILVAPALLTLLCWAWSARRRAPLSDATRDHAAC